MKAKLTLRGAALILIWIFIASACQIPAALPQAAPTPAPVLETPARPDAPTQVVDNTASPTAPAGAAASAGAAVAVKGYVLFERQNAQFNAYAPDGSLLFTSPAPGIQYPSEYNTHVAGSAVYFKDDKTRQVYRSTQEAVERVNIPTNNLENFAVSADQKHLAWATLDPLNGTSELWVANGDGSAARMVANYNAKQSAQFLLSPLEWTADGKLLFDRTITGVGGYILFGGHNSLYSYDPSTGSFVTYVPAEENHGLCLDNYRLDLDKVAFNCTKQGVKIVIRDLLTQKETALPHLPEEGANGSVRFSPSGKWLAYAIAKGNPDDESGQVVVSPADFSAAPNAIVKVENKSFAYVQGWLDEDILLFSRYADADGTLWSVRRDGSELKQVGSGAFIGWIR